MMSKRGRDILERLPWACILYCILYFVCWTHFGILFSILDMDLCLCGHVFSICFYVLYEHMSYLWHELFSGMDMCMVVYLFVLFTYA